MSYKIITPVATEPVTLAEVKAHLRLASVLFSDDILTTQLLVPGSHAANTYTSTGLAVAGKTVIINLNSGENQATGTVAVHIEESDDNITFTDWASGTFTLVTTANDNAVQEIQYTGAKSYIRTVAVVSLAACVFSMDAIINSGDTAEDTQILEWITAARQFGEDHTRHAFAPQTLDFYLDSFPGENKIDWPLGPLTAITSVKYKDYAGTETPMTLTTEYLTDFDTFPGKIFLPYGVYWPTSVLYPYNAITIRGICGYTTIPKPFKQALLMHIGLFYKYRDQEIPTAEMGTIKSLYRPRRVVNV